MSVSDPIADMLTRIRNAVKARFDSVIIPSSGLKTEIAKIMQEEGYISSYEVIGGENSGSIIKIYLKYKKDKTGVIAGLKRVSKPSLRVYTVKEKMPRVMGGLGTVVVSTSRGVMTGKKAKSLGIGGEVVCYLW
jgi:small subunit ribosomal protein S8